MTTNITRDKKMDKVVSLSEAAKIVKSGDTLNIAPTSMAIVREIIRQGATDFFVQGSHPPPQALDMLAALGRLRRFEAISFDYRGAPNCRRAVERGEVKATMVTEAAWLQMVRAAGLGNTFAVQRSMLKTDLFRYLEELGDAAEIACPFTGQRYVALRTPNIDVFMVHAPYADCLGNVQTERGSMSLYEQALMAHKVIVTVEEIIDTEEVMRRPYDTAIPGKFVDAVVKVPYAAHPMGLEGFYEADQDHLVYYTQRAEDHEGFKQYMDKYVFDVKDHMEYLNLIGLERLLELSRTRRI